MLGLGRLAHTDGARVDVVSCAALDAALVSPLLSAAELMRCAGLRRREDRDRFATGRALLRALIGQQLGVPPREVPVSSRCDVCGADHGKPRALGPGGRPPWQASVSHSGEWVTVAVADAPVGVDIEASADVEFASLDDVALSRTERYALSESREDERAAIRARIWVRKEAFLKMHGVGLSVRPDTLTLPQASSSTVTPDPFRPGRMVALHEFAADGDYRGCVALRSSMIPTLRMVDGGPILAAAAAPG